MKQFRELFNPMLCVPDGTRLTTTTARTVPSSLQTVAVGVMDEVMRMGFSAIARFVPDDMSWSQAQLSVCHGGLGLRSAERNASAAYVASRVPSDQLCSAIDASFSKQGRAV